MGTKNQHHVIAEAGPGHVASVARPLQTQAYTILTKTMQTFLTLGFKMNFITHCYQQQNTLWEWVKNPECIYLLWWTSQSCSSFSSRN